MADQDGAPGELQKDAVWTKLVKTVEAKLAERSKNSIRAGVEVVTVPADAVAVPSWKDDLWVVRDPVATGETTDNDEAE